MSHKLKGLGIGSERSLWGALFCFSSKPVPTPKLNNTSLIHSGKQFDARSSETTREVGLGGV